MRYVVEINKCFKGRCEKSEERFLNKALALRRFYLLGANMNTMPEKILKVTIIGPDFYETKTNRLMEIF